MDDGKESKNTENNNNNKLSYFLLTNTESQTANKSDMNINLALNTIRP
jgi:hypothetical protein